MERSTFENIWENGCIILDTCTLDYISRCDFEYAKTIMDLFLFCENNVFVPNHVIEEMAPYFNRDIVHRNATELLKNFENKLYDIFIDNEINIKKKRQKMISLFQKTINLLDKFAFRIYADKLKKCKCEFESSKNAFCIPNLQNYFSEATKEVDSVYRSKTVKDFMGTIMKHRLIDLSENEKVLEKEALERADKGLPPGGGDNYKGKNKYGDFIIWKEILKNIGFSDKKLYLFITEDKKKKNNWYSEDAISLHSYLRNEVVKVSGSDKLKIMDLSSFINRCKPFVNIDLDVLCNHISEKRLIDEIIEYFENDGASSLMEAVSDSVRENHDADWAIPYSYDISVEDLEFDIDEDNGELSIDVTCTIEGDIDACYHWCGEDIIEGAEMYITCTAEVALPIEKGKFTGAYTLIYPEMSINVLDEYLDVDTSDPLHREEDYEPEEDYESDED